MFDPQRATTRPPTQAGASPRHASARGDLLIRVAATLTDSDAAVRRLLGVVLLAGIVYAVAQGPPGLGTSGYGLDVSVLVAAASLAHLAWLAFPRTTRLTAVTATALGVLGAVLGALAPPAGVVFAFVGVLAAGRRLSARTAFAMTLVTASVFAVAGWAAGRSPGLLAGNALGLIVTVLAGVNQAQHRRVREQAELLVAEGQALLDERARSAALDERTRIAREIHDVLSHTLSGVVVQLEAAHLLLGGGGEQARVAGHVDRARRLARSGLDETRRAVTALRSDMPPTAEALSALVNGYRADAGCAATLRVIGDPRPVAAEAGMAVHRAAQEALTNTRRHAPGAEVTVLLSYEDGAVRLVVRDTGPAGVRTAAPEHSGNPGYGLIGMRERAELLGGELTAGSTDDGGWRVDLWIPA